MDDLESQAFPENHRRTLLAAALARPSRTQRVGEALGNTYTGMDDPILLTGTIVASPVDEYTARL